MPVPPIHAVVPQCGDQRDSGDGFSMGGMTAQVIAQTDPPLIRRLVLAGTGPAGGEGIKNVTRISHFDTLRALLTLQDPKQSSSSPAPRTGVGPARSSWPV